MELQGKVLVKGETQEFKGGFRKRDLVIQTDDQYPQSISIEFLQDKVELLDPVQVGDMAKVSINIRGRKWTSPEGEDKYFNSIVGWKIDKAGESAEPEIDNHLPF